MNSINTFDIPKNQISVSAYYVYQEGYSYDELCWLLAERESFIQLNFHKPSKEAIIEKAEQIYNARPPYDVLCWLIGERDLFIKRKASKNALDSLISDETNHI
ncbi:MAG: hypothetical protein EU541_03685 [Promethearchaeota archaeon]|nr:MAG: hypothetical protein EU541_03685 [Candidatus Lokiarchaeota archaeon]